MRKEIEKALLRLRIEGKETRKNMARNILIVFSLIAVFFFIPYFYPQLSQLFVIDALIGLFGGMYVFLNAIPKLYQPLRKEHQAFIKIAKAIEILEKSNEPIAYEEAYRYVKEAYGILRGVELTKYVEWYREVNETFRQFLDNLKFVVLPAISKSNIKKEDLEAVALAVYETNPSEIKAVNHKLEKSYRKFGPPPKKVEMLKKIMRESLIGNILGSLALGYTVVILISLIYVVATQQDFMIFLKERPDIVILGGLILSGVTFWRRK